MCTKKFTSILLISISFIFLTAQLSNGGSQNLTKQDLTYRLQAIQKIRSDSRSSFNSSSTKSRILMPIYNTHLSGAGSIAGTVYGLEPKDIYIAYVEAFSADSATNDGTYYKGLASVNPDGSYQIDSLAAGSYYVCSWADGYVFKYYDNALYLSEATTVTVKAGVITNGVDFKMEKITPGTGSISGKVVQETDNQPINLATVYVCCPDNPMYYGWAESSADGSYLITGLKSGDYYATVWANDYLSEYYDDVYTIEEAQKIQVVEPNETPNINFALSLGGIISGIVTTEAGSPITGVYVEAYDLFEDSTIIVDSGKVFYSLKFYNWATTDENGQYRIPGLPTGDYIVRVQYWNVWNFVEEWYDNATSPEQATSIPVIAGEEVTGVNFVLSCPTYAGIISGRVTDLASTPIAEAYIQVQSNDNTGVWAYATTDREGYYRVEKLLYGNYLVSAWAQSGWQYVQRWWNDAETPDDATPVIVSENTNPDTINFKLPLKLGTASISGTVMSDDQRPLASAYIQISPAEVDSNKSMAVWAYGNSDSSGYYQVDQLPAGSYIVYTSYWENERFGQQWYDRADSLTAATPVVLAEGEKKSDINFSLTLRAMYGSIAGTVVNKITGQPVDRTYIEVMPIYHDNYLMMPSFRFWSYYAITDENGKFKLDWLWEGEYIVSVYANGAFAYYENTPVAELAIPIKITGGMISEVNFALTPRSEGTGIITGRVVSEWESMPFDIAIVKATPVETNQPESFYTAVTNKDGTYELKGLPAGEYSVMSFAPYTIGEYYDNVYDPSQATPVIVDGISPTPGIDFSLSMIWYLKFQDELGGALANTGIIGRVTDQNNHAIADATIYLLNESAQPVSFTRTKTDGSYQLSGIPPGSYILQASKISFNTLYNGNVDSFAEAVPVQAGAGVIEVNFTLSNQTSIGIDGEDKNELPQTIIVYGNYPNPFNPSTWISYSIPAMEKVKLIVFDVRGRQVVTLVDKQQSAGRYSIQWDAQDLPSGVYFCRFRAGQFVQTIKMALIR